VFQDVHAPDVPGFGVAAGGGVQRDAGEVAVDVTGDAVVEVLVIPSGPFAGDIQLGTGREDNGEGKEQDRDRARKDQTGGLN
jgi:hypothetical protein